MPPTSPNLLLALAFLMAALPADAQRRRTQRINSNHAPRTVEESIKAAEEKEQERREEFFNWWGDEMKQHYRNQDKATRKRMRQNARRQKRASQGRSIPWWKRIFGR
jgi:hypothetical protein